MIESKEHSQVEIGSNRSFGIVFCVVFTIVGLWPLMSGGGLRIWSLAIAGVFLVIAMVMPTWLTPLNKLWFRFGLLLAKVINPLVMLLIYVIAIVPIAISPSSGWQGSAETAT